MFGDVGYNQTTTTDYEETFSLVAKLNSARILQSIAKRMDWELHQLVAKNAFPHGYLQEEVYAQQPPRFNSLMKGSKLRFVS